MATVAFPSIPEAVPDDFPPETMAPPSDVLFEIVDGRFVEKSVGAYEIELAWYLQDLMAAFVRPNRLGRVMAEALFDLRPAVPRGCRPDVAFLSAERWPLDRRGPRTSTWRIVPDLAVEIVSSTNTANEVVEKIEEYFRAGMVRVWVVYPDVEKVYEYDSPTSVRIVGHHESLTDEGLLPGFRLELAEFFGPPV